ncbi:MAG: MMPL family transporter, partial [Bacilli bacterium]|nr:MMPL family transporter [Bacilli bacterium]
MKKFAKFICEHKNLIIGFSVVLFVLSLIGNALTHINYDILVYLPDNIDTIKGQNILTDDFGMGGYSIAIMDGMDAKQIVKLKEDLQDINGVGEVISLYDIVGTTIPIEMLPKEIISKLHDGNSDLLFITFTDSTSSELTLQAVSEIRNITEEHVKLGGMSSMVLDTMNLSNKEIAIYIIIAVALCIIVLELALDSFIVPILLLLNIGIAIIFNLGSNIFLGQISYITKALVAVLQLGVTTDFSIFLYHSYEAKKKIYKNHKDAMVEAICETFTSVTGSSLTTIIGFLVLLVPFYLAQANVDVYYKIDKTLPDTLESIEANKILKDKFNMVSMEIVLLDKNLKQNDMNNLINDLENTEGIDFVLSMAKLQELNITNDIIPEDLKKVFISDKYQMLMFNSIYDIASDDLNKQVEIVDKIVKKYDKNALVAGEGPLMKDLIEISNTDFNNVNVSIVLKSLSLPFLLIIAIEFAIFLNMGIAYFSGNTLPFVAPIVLGTIQLGATIDYAILMTTTYLEKRKSGLNKKDAMYKTLEYSGNSIFVSGMCFFAATFGVGVYSDLEMVGSLCSLISRGAIISMLVVITILPSILLIFDKLIMKTTIHGKDDIKMKNKNLKKLG